MLDSGLRSYLFPGERVLWEGHPEVGPFMLRGAWYLIPFSLLWGGFAFFWEFMAVRGGAPLFFAIWGVPFVLVGAYLIFGRLLVARREAMNTAYAITDRRVLILSGAFRRSFTSIELGQLPLAQLDEGAGGVGTITFGSGGFMRVPPGWPTMGAYQSPPSFQAIEGVRGVFDTLQRARADLTASERS